MQILVVRSDRPRKTLDDIKNSKKPVSLGAHRLAVLKKIYGF